MRLYTSATQALAAGASSSAAPAPAALPPWPGIAAGYPQEGWAPSVVQPPPPQPPSNAGLGFIIGGVGLGVLGVGAAVIQNGTIKHVLLLELLTEYGAGTLVS